MVSMCSIPHHTPRHRKGWTTACKPSSSLFSCYSLQRHNLIFPGVWTHFSIPISSLFMGYGLIVWFGQGFMLPCRRIAVNAASRWR